MVNLHDETSNLSSRQDLIRFMRSLSQGFTQSPDSWENRDIASYLDAMAAWLEDMDGYYENREQAIPRRPTWRLFGELLLAARYYE